MEFSAKQIADLIGGEIIGDEQATVRTFAKIEEGIPGALSFLSNPKYTPYIYTTKSSIVLVNRDFQPEHPIAATLIKVDNAYDSLAKLLTIYEESKPKKEGVSSLAYVSESAKIGKHVYIGPFAFIGANVIIGEHTTIHPNVTVGDNAQIGSHTILYPQVSIYHDCIVGNECIIHSGAVIGADGFGFAPTSNGYEKIPQIGNVILEDNTEVGANTTIDRATMGSTRIGEGTKLDNLIQVAHNVEVGKYNVFAAQTGIAGSTIIGNYNRVGGQCGFAGHIKVGDNNEFGAQSGIPNNVGNSNRLIGYPAIDARSFAKNLVYIKKLESLFKNNKK